MTIEDLIRDVDLVIAATTEEEIFAIAGSTSMWKASTYDELVWRLARFAITWGKDAASTITSYDGGWRTERVGRLTELLGRLT